MRMSIFLTVCFTLIIIAFGYIAHATNVSFGFVIVALLGIGFFFCILYFILYAICHNTEQK